MADARAHYDRNGAETAQENVWEMFKISKYILIFRLHFLVAGLETR